MSVRRSLSWTLVAVGVGVGGVAIAGAGTVPTGAMNTGSNSADAPAAVTVRQQGLAAAAAWNDGLLTGPRVPAPGNADLVIVLIDGPAIAAVPPARRAERAAAIVAEQRRIEKPIRALGGRITARWRTSINGFAVEVPAGRSDSIALIDGVRLVTPVSYLAPAAARAANARPAKARNRPAMPAGRGPAHVALIDTAIDPRAPQLGGGVGPTFPIIGGADLVERDTDPTVGDRAPRWEGHGTQMAGLILGAPALDGLPPNRAPRLLSYRVVAEESVAGTTVPLARTDRVITAVERAVDPNGDGNPVDRADVVVLGLAGSFAGAGADPVSFALSNASRVGSVVVVPAGNDGPTFSGIGSLGAPAASDAVITVGGTTESMSPRTATLAVGVGPAAANLENLPVIGPDPTAEEHPLVVVRSPDGVSQGGSRQDYIQTARDGANFAGAVVVVSRGGIDLHAKAALAAEAGAAAIVVWDAEGNGIFPAGTRDGDAAIPIVGVGPDQGRALLELDAAQDGVTPVRIKSELRREEAPTVASFSSTGPTVDGRVKPDVVAPAVRVDAPWPPAPDGSAQTAPMSGTSAATAQVAAVALRARIDHPNLTPADVKAALANGARPLSDVRLAAQGSGVLGDADVPPVRIAPSGVVARASNAPRVVPVRVVDLSAAAGRYRIEVVDAGGDVRWVGPVFHLRAGVTLDTEAELPGVANGWSGSVRVRRGNRGPVVARVPAATFRAPRSGHELEPPKVSTRGGVTSAVVRIGRLTRSDARIRSAPLHNVRLTLIPGDGSEPLEIAGVGARHDWTPGTYTFVLSRRLPTGGQVPAGRYRLRVTGTSVAGKPRQATSDVFQLG